MSLYCSFQGFSEDLIVAASSALPDEMLIQGNIMLREDIAETFFYLKSKTVIQF